MKLDITSFLVSIGLVVGGIILLKGDPSNFRGYENIKNNPRKVKKFINKMKFVGVWLFCGGLLWIFIHIIYLFAII